MNELRHIDLYSDTDKLASIFPQNIDHSGYVLFLSWLQKLDVKGIGHLPDASILIQPLSLGFFGVNTFGLLMSAFQWAVLLLAALPHVLFDLEFFDAAFISMAVIVLGNLIVFHVLRNANSLSKFHIVNAMFNLVVAMGVLTWLYFQGGS